MTNTQPSAGILAARVFWMMIGPFILLVLAFSIARTGASWLTSADIFFAVVLGTVILCRWLEFLGGNPQTVTGDPAAPGDLRRFVIGAFLAGIGTWVIAKAVGLQFFGQ